jgi:hypothetical protein
VVVVGDEADAVASSILALAGPPSPPFRIGGFVVVGDRDDSPALAEFCAEHYGAPPP